MLYVGRFDKLKGGDTVLSVFRRLLDMDPELRLIFVGPDIGLSSQTTSAVYFSEFSSRLFTPAEKRNIEYVGQLPRRAIFELRPRAMVTLVTSRWENQPNTALEAMMQGCPIVACDTGGMGEIIQHDATGLLADPTDTDDFCRKVITLLRNPSKAYQLGRQAREFVINRHSIECIVAETLDVYRQRVKAPERGL